MDMRESAESREFRSGVREWVMDNLPPEVHEPYAYKGGEEDPAIERWFDRLAKKQWLAFRWPKQFGGPGFSQAEQVVFVDELVNCGARVPRGFGVSMVGPLLLQFGADWQKERFLPPIARNEERWCQGYSEPNAGSDLASLQTRAEADGEDFIVNGQKTWTSRAGSANWIFALVRTDTGGQKQKGISFLLIDMKSPGISVRPIRQIDGGASFFETFLDNVRVPRKNLVGKINEGWSIAKALLGFERVTSGTDVNLPGLVNTIRTLARDYQRQGHPVLVEAAFRDRLVALEMDVDCLRYTRYRMMTALLQGKAPGPEASIFKVFQTELCQRLHDLALDAMGPDAAAWYDARLSPEGYGMPMAMTMTRAMSIYAGSNEIQRNIIAKRVLNLPD